MRCVIGLLVIVSAASVAYSQPATVAERAALYQRIARMDSTAELERLALETAASTDPAKAAQLALILDRYFELDAAGAVKLAGELQRSGSPSFVGTLYGRLARSDVNEALSALSQVDDLAEARPASMAVFHGLGADERAFELVAASLQGGAREQFRSDALVQLAATSPQRALDEALAVTDPGMRRTLATTIVSRWANEAPSEAIAAADRVADPDLRSSLRTTVLRNWRDTDTLLTYVAALDPASRGKALVDAGLERLAARDASRAAGIRHRERFVRRSLRRRCRQLHERVGTELLSGAALQARSDELERALVGAEPVEYRHRCGPPPRRGRRLGSRRTRPR